jgi:hypothetical protein
MSLPNALALDLFGCDVYTFSLGAAGALSFHDPFEGTETEQPVFYSFQPAAGAEVAK